MVVKPLLNISLFTRHRVDKVEEHILGIEIENTTSNKMESRGVSHRLDTLLLTRNNISIIDIFNDIDQLNNVKYAPKKLSYQQIETPPLLRITRISCYSKQWIIEKLIPSEMFVFKYIVHFLNILMLLEIYLQLKDAQLVQFICDCCQQNAINFQILT